MKVGFLTFVRYPALNKHKVALKHGYRMYVNDEMYDCLADDSTRDAMMSTMDWIEIPAKFPISTDENFDAMKDGFNDEVLELIFKVFRWIRLSAVDLERIAHAIHLFRIRVEAGASRQKAWEGKHFEQLPVEIQAKLRLNEGLFLP